MEEAFVDFLGIPVGEVVEERQIVEGASGDCQVNLASKLVEEQIEVVGEEAFGGFLEMLAGMVDKKNRLAVQEAQLMVSQLEVQDNLFLPSRILYTLILNSRSS